jgi:hypothetical protein
VAHDRARNDLCVGQNSDRYQGETPSGGVGLPSHVPNVLGVSLANEKRDRNHQAEERHRRGLMERRYPRGKFHLDGQPSQQSLHHDQQHGSNTEPEQLSICAPVLEQQSAQAKRENPD